MMPTLDMSRLAGITLSVGSHETPDDGLCLMEAVAYMAGEPHTANPACVSAVLTVMGRGLNDILPTDVRQRLVPLIPELIGTVRDGHDKQRSYLALDWLIRTWMVAWLDIGQAYRKEAARLRGLDRIVDLDSARCANAVLRQVVATASKDTAITKAVIGNGATVAAVASVTDAAMDALDVTMEAVYVDTAIDVTASVVDAAMSVTEGVVMDIALGVVMGFVGHTTDADTAARRAAMKVLRPTVNKLQVSLIELYSRMVRSSIQNTTKAPR